MTYPKPATALRISFLSIAPLPSSSHSRKRSISLTAFSSRMTESCHIRAGGESCHIRVVAGMSRCHTCSATLMPEVVSNLTISSNAATRAEA